MDTKRFVMATTLSLVLLTGCGEKEYGTLVKPVETIHVVAEDISPVEVTTEVTKPVEVTEPVVEELVVVEPVVEPELPKTKTYRVTAYCPCEICCGKWAKNRPIGEDGKPIVIGAWGVALTDGYSVASPMAFGTQVELEGIGTVEVQDRTAKWIVDKHGEDIIDLYMTNHEEARKFGVKYLEGVIK